LALNQDKLPKIIFQFNNNLKVAHSAYNASWLRNPTGAIAAGPLQTSRGTLFVAPMGYMPNIAGNVMPIPSRHFITPFLKAKFPWQKQRLKPKISTVFSPFYRQIKVLVWATRRETLHFGAQYPAYTHPCQRFGTSATTGTA
jgi:hypothetical protein